MSLKLPILLCLISGAACADVRISFQRPFKVMMDEQVEFSSRKMPIGPFADGEISAIIAEGPTQRKVWRVRLSGAGTLDVADALRQQIEAKGFELLFECQTDGCGGFDFRFNTEIVNPPVMHVDLGDFRYFVAQRLGSAAPEYINFVISKSGDRAYVQMISVGTAELTTFEPVTPTPTVVDASSLIGTLETAGSAPLDDLVFPSGSSSLGEGEFATLDALARYLADNPDRKMVLVGHTDAVGSLDANISLARARAASVVARLIKLGAARRQLVAEGIGYLSPRTINETDEGRAENRRVEAVLLPAE